MTGFIKLLQFIDKEKLADFVEVGVPFSDPVADGIVIQNSSQHALKNGATFKRIIGEVGEIRNKIDIPLVLMTYLNPLYSGNYDKNMSFIGQAGFSAVIVPDLPVDESGQFMDAARSSQVYMVFLASPATLPERINRISARSRPFLYYVSRFGITGERKTLSEGISKRINLVKRHSEVPVYCGFGISSPRQAGIVGRSADGIIIGSALIRLIQQNRNSYFKDIRKFAISIKKELKACRTDKK